MEEFAREWADAVLDTSLVSLSREEAREFIGELTASLVAALRAEEFDTTVAAKIGEQLVENHFVGPEALAQTQYLLTTGLPEALPKPVADHIPDRLARAQAGLTQGYIRAMRQQLFDSQETIKKAALHAQVKAERARAASEAQFAAVFASADVGIAIGDIDGNIVEANRALEKMLGRANGALRGNRFDELASEPEAARKLRDGLDALKSGEPSYRTQIKLRGAADDPKSVKIALTLVHDNVHEAAYPVMVFSDVTDLNLLHERIGYQNVTDSLTGLPNKSQLITQLERTLYAAARAGEQIGLVFMDIDGFKVIQDGLGPSIGDQVLQSVANRLRQVFAGPDMLVARMTGDGFAVVVGGNVGQQELTALVDEALQQLVEPVYFDDQGVSISASVAVVVQPAADYTPVELIRAAEITVHRAKYGGKSQWMLFDPKLDAEDRARYRLGAGLGGALENGELMLEFQPLVRLDSREFELFAVYASPHWEHPELGSLTAERFAPIAVETGLMLPAGRWLLEQGCRQAAEWQAAHGATARPVRLRLPERLMRDEDLVGYVMHELERNRLEPNLLQIQLPATAMVNDAGDPLDSIEILHEHGLGFILEASGTAELDLVCRLTLPVQGIHLDATLVAAVTGRSDANSVPVGNLEYLTRQATALNLTVTAEDVATPEAAARLHECGVTAASGDFTGDVRSTSAISTLIQRVPTP